MVAEYEALEARAARATLDRHDARFDAIDRRLATIEDTLAAHTGRLEGIEDALSSQSQMLREILRRLPEEAGQVS